MNLRLLFGDTNYSFYSDRMKLHSKSCTKFLDKYLKAARSAAFKYSCDVRHCHTLQLAEKGAFTIDCPIACAV